MNKQVITSIIPGEKLDIEIRFFRPMKSIAQTPFTTTFVAENQTEVKWAMQGNTNYPLNLVNPLLDIILVQTWKPVWVH